MTIWAVVGVDTHTWDIESLVLGLGWVTVAQISLFAYIRRSERATGGGEEIDLESRPAPRIRARALILAVAAGLLLCLWIAGFLSTSAVAVLAGGVAVLLALSEGIAWLREREQIPWSSLSLGSGGVGVMLLQASDRTPLAVARTPLLYLAFGFAIMIWVGLLARDVRELTARA